MPISQALSRAGPLACLLVAASAIALSAQAPSNDVVAGVLARLVHAEDSAGRSQAISELLALRPPFSQAYEALARGRAYSADVPVGRVQSTRESEDGTSFPYFIQVPESYDAARRYPVRVFLHGGVSRPAWDPRELWWSRPSRLASEEYIGLFPAAWRQQRWWTAGQLANLRGLLGTLKRTYNVDENRVALFGVSDGGTGAFWVAFRDPTPWAAFLPFIGHPAVLLNPGVAASAPVYARNLSNKPLYIVNGGTDRLYPTRAMDPYVAEFEGLGADIVYRRMEGFGHETTWWPDEAPRIETFLAEHVRDPHPTRIRWETESTEAAGRVHWVRIDVPGYTARDARFGSGGLLDTGVPGSRIDVVREDNTVRVRSEGVLEATYLISPEAFDLTRPIQVIWNDVTVFDGWIAEDLATLLRWFDRDEDRTMLYAAELTLTAPLASPPSPH